MRSASTRAHLALVAALLAVATSGCAGRWAYRQGEDEAKKGNWDLAVARYTKALEKDRDNIGYKIALENARIQASRYHYLQAKKQLAAQDLTRALEELEIASRYDPSNKAASDDTIIVREKIRREEEERQRRAEFDKLRKVDIRSAVPVLSARSTVPITLKFTDTGIEKIFETLGKLAGVNVLFDEGFRDKKVTVNLTGITFQEALDQLAFVNRLFYKVLDANTIIIVPDSPAKRRTYEDVLLRTFYLQNTEAKDVEGIVKTVLGATAKVGSNANLNAITIIATPDELAVAEKIIDSNDKARGEVMVEVQIMEVNRNSTRKYGIELSNYELQGQFSPTGATGESAGGFANLRAHLLASLNLADFVVTIPNQIFARFLQNDDTARILANPRLRAAEGKATTLKIGTEVPIPVTTFTATQAGTSTFAPATSFQYKVVGVNLKITPKVSAGGEIALELAAEFSLLGADRNVGTGQNPINVPTFNTRNIDGVIRVRDGETTLLGGFITSRETASFRGALGLQSVPILNRIIPSTQKQDEYSEIVISLTPHLVRAPKVTEEDVEPLLIGTRETIRVQAARPLFGPEVDPESAVIAPTQSGVAGPGPGAAPGATGGTPRQERPPAATPPPPGPVAEPRPVPDSGPVPPPPGEPSGPAPEPAPTPAPNRTSVVLNPPETTFRTGDTASVAVVLMNVQGLTSSEVVLAYDPTVVEAQDIGSGPLLTVDGAPVSVEKSLEAGRVRARFSRQSGVSGSGVVALVTFRAVNAGASAVTLDALTLETAAGPERAGAQPARLVVNGQ